MNLNETNISINDAFLFSFLFSIFSTLFLAYIHKLQKRVLLITNFILCVFIPPVGWVYFIVKIYKHLSKK